MSDEEIDSNRRNAGEVFRAFLKLGLTSFGGPVAHLGYFREEFMVRRRWVSEQQYAELVALCQFLPGPASSQVGFGLGLARAGYRGAIAAWAAFTLPSALLMIVFASGSVLLDRPAGTGALAGLMAVAVGVVAHAVWGMARSLTPDLRRIAIGIASAAAALLLPGTAAQLGAILFGVVAGGLLCRRTASGSGSGAAPESPRSTGFFADRVSLRAAAGCLAALAGLLIALPVVSATTQIPLLEIADASARAGALAFGGGHIILPLLQAEPAIAGAVTAEQLLTGYTAAQVVPGPMFTLVAYLGAIADQGAPLTALVALVAVFLPGFLLLLGVLPVWNRLRESQAVRAAIRGANAAVVGILAAALYDPVFISGVTGPASLSIALGSLLALATKRVPVWAVVLAGAAAGAAAALLGVAGGWG